jgi:DNA-binding response OmpR family regulator
VPIASGPSARILAWPGRATARAPRRSVLLVEAHADTRELYAIWLRQRDYHVSVAGSAADAVAVARAGAPEVVVVELVLPGGGPALIRSLRAEPATAEALIIVLTTQTQPAVRAEALAAGADIYVLKPCGAPRLGQLIELGSRNGQPLPGEV